LELQFLRDNLCAQLDQSTFQRYGGDRLHAEAFQLATDKVLGQFPDAINIARLEVHEEVNMIVMPVPYVDLDRRHRHPAEEDMAVF